mmetsp:Transcript_18521/g.42240  ORF Transcript_18521/g.42240 Transcript_18521/m.42240 type:complete len:208 (+) Transcript_18521:1447-2070(+)
MQIQIRCKRPCWSWQPMPQSLLQAFSIAITANPPMSCWKKEISSAGHVSNKSIFRIYQELPTTGRACRMLKRWDSSCLGQRQYQSVWEISLRSCIDQHQRLPTIWFQVITIRLSEEGKIGDQLSYSPKKDRSQSKMHRRCKEKKYQTLRSNSASSRSVCQNVKTTIIRACWDTEKKSFPSLPALPPLPPSLLLSLKCLRALWSIQAR